MKTSIIIASRLNNGIRRCGVFHPREEVEHPLDTFTPEQLKTLKADPDLIVLDPQQAGSTKPRDVVPIADYQDIVRQLQDERARNGQLKKELEAVSADLAAA